ncbi:MAG: glycosyltransferase family 2 protein, partial [Verrucomicrobia bacterium]|nr:glycosyltransferase family 2 protein [Verrucomicrobiota bacterium]
VYNGEQTVGLVVEDILKTLDDVLLEIVLVNDGSPDGSGRVCEELVVKHAPRVKYVELSRNFTEHNAVMAGLLHTSGDYVVEMDDDCQNPAPEVRLMLDEIRKGFDVVYSYYEKKRHHFLRNLGSWFNDRVATIMLKKPRDLYLSSFKVMNRFIVNEMVRCANPYPYIDGLIFQITTRISKVKVEHKEREHKRSNYTVSKLVGLWLNMFINFSILPLRLATYAGFAMAACGLGLGVFSVVERILKPDLPTGFASLIVSILLIGGIQCFLLGMLGEYLGRLFLSVNRKPQFVVRRKLGWD